MVLNFVVLHLFLNEGKQFSNILLGGDVDVYVKLSLHGYI